MKSAFEAIDPKERAYLHRREYKILQGAKPLPAFLNPWSKESLILDVGLVSVLAVLRKIALLQKSYAMIYTVGIIAVPCFEFLRMLKLDRRGPLRLGHRKTLEEYNEPIALQALNNVKAEFKRQIAPLEQQLTHLKNLAEKKGIAL